MANTETSVNVENKKEASKKYSIKEKMLKLLAPTIFLVFTFAVYMPSSLYLSNINEFAVDYIKVLPLILFVAAVIMILVYIVGLVIYHKRIFDSYVLLVFSLAAGFYIQGNFLNPAFDTLNGKDIDWSAYKINGIISIIAWILCFVIPQVIYVFKKNIIALVSKWGSWLLTAMQLVSLVVLILTTQKTIVNDFAVTKNGEFELSTKNNTVMFVVDTLDASWFEEMVLSDEGYKEDLKDFTYFDDAVAGGSPTVLGIPTLLTGKIDMHAEQDYEDFYKEAYGNSTLFKDLQDANYQVKLYTEYFYLDYCDKENVDNLKFDQQYVVSSPRGFIGCLYKFVSFYSMPQFLKQNFWLYSGEFSNYISIEDTSSNMYKMDDAGFYQDFKNSGITTQNEKNTFVMYHLNGSHGPYVMNENAEAVPENSVGVDSQTRGSFKIITDYIKELKAKGLYDNTTIIITADHGGVDLYQNPAVMVKQKNTNQNEIAVNSSKITFTNLNATIASSCIQDASSYGEDVFQVGDKNVVRFHVAPNDLTQNVYKDDPAALTQEWSLLIIPADAKARDLSKFVYVHYDQFDELMKKYNIKVE